MLTARCVPQVGTPFDIDYAVNIKYLWALNQLGTFEIKLVSSAEERAKYDYNDREIILSGRDLAVKLLWKITAAAKEYLNQYPDVVIHDLLEGTGIDAIHEGR